MAASFIHKFIFDQLPIKGSLVVLQDCWDTITQLQAYPASLQQLLGELVAANVLLTANLKLNGKVICQVQNNPAFNLAVSECSNNLNIRATAKFDPAKLADVDYTTLVKHGRLVVSIDSQNEGNLYQSIIAFSGENLAEILNAYMAQSEQLRTWFLLAYTDHKIVGFMLQQLPDTTSQFANDIERVFMLAETLTKSELLHDELTALLNKLFHEDNLRVFEPQMIQFKCSCSRERVSEILRSLGEEEIDSLIAEQGNIVVDCDYCNAKYHYTGDELRQLSLLASLESKEVISHEIN
jgi:molecular chaperone Hsp33